MRTLAWSQLRFRTTRLIALLAGMLLATTAFTVLTAASQTAQLRTVGTVTAHFVPAYDILVRPAGARSKLEKQTDTVQPNFLSGIYGGISLAQYHQIEQIPGVQVAAPIAMIGYSLLSAAVPFAIPAASYTAPGRHVYRISTTWVSDAGTSRIAQPPSYVYVTPDKLTFDNISGGIREVIPGGGSPTVCPLTPVPLDTNPFGVAAQSNAYCWSEIDGMGLPQQPTSPQQPDYIASWVIPVLIAAIDPAAEARLDGLNKAVTSGAYLAEDAGDIAHAGAGTAFPVLASSSSGMDEYAVTELQQLTSPAAPPSVSTAWMTQEAAAPGRTLVTERTTAQQAYRQLLTTMRQTPPSGALSDSTVFGYWSVGPTSYQRTAAGALVPQLVHNPGSVWYAGGIPDVSMDNEDNQYRAITPHTHPSNQYFDDAGSWASPRLVGVFDPAKIKAFDPLSQVPLGGYEPVVAAPESAASKRALHGSDLLPNQNLAGYVGQPVNLITTLSALPALLTNTKYGTSSDAADPISVIRVRVTGVTGPNPVSLERIREVAQQIELRTHLDVDIVAGSSPAPTTIDLAAGKFGQPALTLSEGWVRKGVAIAILTAIDKNSLVLFTLILVV
ncbi:MAG: hypothetical protein WBH47_04015, partial [Streptosporangiaceae bacterium]